MFAPFVVVAFMLVFVCSVVCELFIRIGPRRSVGRVVSSLYEKGAALRARTAELVRARIARTSFRLQRYTSWIELNDRS